MITATVVRLEAAAKENYKLSTQWEHSTNMKQPIAGYVRNTSKNTDVKCPNTAHANMHYKRALLEILKEEIRVLFRIFFNFVIYEYKSEFRTPML